MSLFFEEGGLEALRIRQAKQQLAEFTKAAMQGLCSAEQLGGDHWIAETACRIARATIDEMIRREKEDDSK